MCNASMQEREWLIAQKNCVIPFFPPRTAARIPPPGSLMSSSRPFALVIVLYVTAFMNACNPEALQAPAAADSRGTAGATSTAKGTSTSGSNSDPNFLNASPTAPTIANPVVAFWAKKGVDQYLRMYYHARPGHNDSTTFMIFRVRPKSLNTRADGSALASGDSLLITATLVDAVHLKVDFQPAGLQFSASDPAVLRFNFAETVRDLNGDGVVNFLDYAIQRTFRIWCRETLLDPWQPLPSLVVDDVNEVQANIGGFTGYAAAY